MNSFSSEVKKELSELNNLSKKNLVKAELKGYLATNSSNEFTTSSQYNINRYGKLLNNIGENDFNISIKGNHFTIKTKARVKVEQRINSEDEIKAFIRGAFLGSGTITNPENIYNLNISFENEENAVLIKTLLEEKDIKSKIIDRTKKYIVYIKDAENISKFLALIGANKSVLKFEDMRVIKDVRNKVNRMVNYETANLNKTINSSVKQIENIKLIKSKNKFNLLSDNEKELANIRLKNPEASLTELSNMIKPPLSKSGVNHRMKKIEELANKLK